MNFTIDRLVLLDNLNNVSHAISTKVQMPGLTGIKFEVRKEALTLITNNNEISIKAVIKNNYNCISEGDFILSGKILVDVVKKLVYKDVDFMSFDDKTIKILSGKSDFTLTCIDLDSFIEVPFAKTDVSFNIDALNLKALIRKTIFAISNSDSRPILSGVCMKTSSNVLEFLATDSFRLARKQIIFNYQFPNINVIIPGKNFEALNKIIGESEENVEVYCSSSYVLFKYSNISFQSRLIKGTFPNVNSLIPTDSLSKIKFNKDELISTIDRVSLFVNYDASNIVKFTMSNEGFVEFSTESAQLGNAKEEVVPLSINNNGNYQISFSSKYFLDALKAFDDSQVYINFTGDVKPFTITSDKDVNLIQLILPLRS